MNAVNYSPFLCGAADPAHFARTPPLGGASSFLVLARRGVTGKDCDHHGSGGPRFLGHQTPTCPSPVPIPHGDRHGHHAFTTSPGV